MPATKIFGRVTQKYSTLEASLGYIEAASQNGLIKNKLEVVA
jgi:hypothetical protein